MSIFMPIRRILDSDKWRRDYDHRFWAARPILRADWGVNHVQRHSAYAMRMRMRGSRIKWGAALDTRKCGPSPFTGDRHVLRRKQYRADMRVLPPWHR